MFGLKFNNLNMPESINAIDKIIQENRKNMAASVLVTPNVDHIVNINKDSEFKEIYQRATLTLVDGAPVFFASRLLKKPLKAKVSGADLVPKIFELANRKNYTVFIFGSRDGIPQMAIDKVNQMPNYSVDIDYYSPPFGFESDAKEVEKGINKIKEFSPDILLVSLGSPKGERFIFENYKRLNVPISLQIGAAIDFLAGTVKRAPVWMQRVGLEWFYRFSQEPKRMYKRYFINDPYFLVILLKEYFKKE